MPHHSMSSESKVLVGGFTQVTKQQGLLVSYQSGALAQLVEQLTFNQLVDGSNPSCPTIFRQSLLNSVFLKLQLFIYKHLEQIAVI